ncbi:transposase, MuDR, MULE transposase domain protein [Tanacetum coccineum]|uniref:Transposase, MuDR, MULE transposase domain protein n=1 Tax=Tanacetum coccineum TaxID=301880 RepID=A0ABQ4Z589_9ASTR
MSGLEDKFSVFLVCEDVVYGALLRKNITYKELVGYVRKKFSINHTFDISFHYDVGSSVVRIDDDNDVEFFGNEVYNSLATTSHKLFVKKGDDFDNKEHCMYVIGKKALDEGFEFKIRSFLTHMRPLLITDGAHLKGTYKGTNLVLVGMDGNNQIVPIATGVSQDETGESWTWFLLKFKECIGEVPNLAIITDRHPAIILTCNTIFPNAFYGYCCRHLMMNCKMKSDKLPEAYKKLEEAGFETWSRAMCPADRYNYMTSNSVESINNLTRHVRKAPITQLMEWYRALLQKWYCACRDKYKDSDANTLSDWATHKVMDRMQKNAHWKVLGIEYGIPSGHVIAVGRKIGCTDCSHLALGWFRKTTLYSTYQDLVYPVGKPSSWVSPDGLQVVKLPNMNFRTAGRPKNTDRIKSQGEEPIQTGEDHQEPMRYRLLTWSVGEQEITAAGGLVTKKTTVYLLYGSVGGHVITAAGGRSYKENNSSWFLLVVPAGRLCGSYWSAYGFFCLPCPILFVIAASIIASQSEKEQNSCQSKSHHRGVLLDSHMCPLCNAAMEDVQHVFFFNTSISNVTEFDENNDEYEHTLIDDIDHNGFLMQEEVTYVTHIYHGSLRHTILGRKFSSFDDAYDFYNQYGRSKGFGIRKHQLNRYKDTNKVCRRKFICNKEGFMDMNDKRQLRDDVKRHCSIRTSCKALMQVTLSSEGGEWVVDKFNDEYNHPFDYPSKVIKQRSHNMFHHSNECKDVVTLLSKAGMKPSEITKIVYAFRGGEEDQLTRVQCSTIVSDERKCNLGIECHGIIMHFKEKVELDKDFLLCNGHK